MACLRKMATDLLSFFLDVGVHTTPMHRIRCCVLAAAPLLAHCAGEVEAPAGPVGGAEQAPIGALCEAGPPAPAPLRRLTKTQYVNSLRAILDSALTPVEMSIVWREVEPSLASLPNDVTTKQQPFESMDSTLSQQHVVQYMRVSQGAARAIVANPIRMHDFVSCRVGEPADSCIDGFLTRLATRAYRRPPNKAEKDFLREVYADDKISAEAVADAITFVLNAPQFLYQLELGSEPVPDQPDVFALSDHELASRMALQFWQAPPDDELLAAADRGELRTTEGYERQLDRVLADPRAKVGLQAFVSQWLNLESLPPLDGAVGNPIFEAFAGEDLPSPALRGDMIHDVVESFRYHFTADDTYEKWLLSPYSFAQSDDLAQIYGTPKWRGTGEPPQFPPGQRSGLITRAALLATGSANTRPIMKGVLLRERLLCDELLPPDPTQVNAVAQTLSEQRTTREAVEALTEKPGSTCSGCHTKQINGLGFATENYDALGRLRDHQSLFSEDGRMLAQRPVSTRSLPFVEEGDARPVEGASDLAQRLVESTKAEQCFARQYVRFTFGRREDKGDRSDMCMTNEVQVMLQKGSSMKAAVKALAMRPEFRTRVLSTAK
jgi:hypothetical protein